MRTLEQYGRVVRTDVAIIGGGLAGNCAAIAAAEQGVDVVIVEKAGFRRCGAIAGGVDHFMAYLNTEEWDTKESYLNYATNVAKGAINLRVHDACVAQNIPEAIYRLEKRYGISLAKENGTYYRTRSFGQPGPFFINFNGKNLKPRLADVAEKSGVKCIERTMATHLLKDEYGRVCGVFGFNIRTGGFIIIMAKAVILCTGCTTRLFEHHTGLAFNTWQCPADTGAAQVMALEAGAKLANMEYMRITLVPKGFSAAGLNALVGMGARILNALGDEFMRKYHPLGIKAPRHVLVSGVMTEIKEGRGPIFIDCSHLGAKEIEHLKQTLGYDKDTLPDFFQQKGIEISKDLIEITYSEGMQAGPSEIVGSGVMIDERGMSTVEGLFGAGDCTDQMRCVHGAIAGGFYVGEQAAQYAKDLDWKDYGKGEFDRIGQLCAEIIGPLRRKRGLKWYEIEDSLRKIMWAYAGPARNELSLKTALVKIGSLEEALSEVRAANSHELMRTWECYQLIQVAKVMCTASLFRKETRFGIFHYRTDYPDTKSEYQGEVTVWKENERLQTEFVRLEY